MTNDQVLEAAAQMVESQTARIGKHETASLIRAMKQRRK